VSERGFLLLSASGTGTALGGTELAGYAYRNGMVYWQHSAVTSSANSASVGATLYANPHPDLPWYPITSWAFTGAANSGSAIMSANYGHLKAAVDW
jgi:hypothetical protein